MPSKTNQKPHHHITASNQNIHSFVKTEKKPSTHLQRRVKSQSPEKIKLIKFIKKIISILVSTTLIKNRKVTLQKSENVKPFLTNTSPASSKEGVSNNNNPDDYDPISFTPDPSSNKDQEMAMNEKLASFSPRMKKIMTREIAKFNERHKKNTENNNIENNEIKNNDTEVKVSVQKPLAETELPSLQPGISKGQNSVNAHLPAENEQLQVKPQENKPPLKSALKSALKKKTKTNEEQSPNTKEPEEKSVTFNETVNGSDNTTNNLKK